MDRIPATEADQALFQKVFGHLLKAQMPQPQRQALVTRWHTSTSAERAAIAAQFQDYTGPGDATPLGKANAGLVLVRRWLDDLRIQRIAKARTKSGQDVDTEATTKIRKHVADTRAQLLVDASAFARGALWMSKERDSERQKTGAVDRLRFAEFFSLPAEGSADYWTAFAARESKEANVRNRLRAVGQHDLNELADEALVAKDYATLRAVQEELANPARRQRDYAPARSAVLQGNRDVPLPADLEKEIQTVTTFEAVDKKLEHTALALDREDLLDFGQREEDMAMLAEVEAVLTGADGSKGVVPPGQGSDGRKPVR